MHLIIRSDLRYQEDRVAWCNEALEAIAQVVKFTSDRQLEKKNL